MPTWKYTFFYKGLFTQLTPLIRNLVTGFGLCALTSLSFAASLPSNRISDIENTAHNFSAIAPATLPDGTTRRVEATAESEICVFCHTPHAAELGVGPIWNRKLSGATYAPYDSSSLDATASQPGGTSKLCLSCHDGALAIGAVNMANATYTDQNPLTEDLAMNISGGGTTMPNGEGTTSGYTRNLGSDLTNDHPISFTYNTALATTDGELRDPQLESHLGNRSPGVQPFTPLEQDQVQCISCHDPHIRSTIATENIKFLRLNRLQQTSPIAAAAFDEDTDIICLACHDKAGWAGSAHASDLVANEIYLDSVATLREFPLNTQVWQTACLACHDTHAVQGSRRLLWEGTDGTPNVNGAKQGGNPAIEETCYACHSSDGGTLTSQGINTEVPDIKTDFSLAVHMPITTAEQAASTEIHDIGSSALAGSGKDFLESQLILGKGDLLNRHAECTDCHNPHRVIKNRQFNADYTTPDAAGTHDHAAASHSNLASGVLRGTWGVEPIYAVATFGIDPTGFTVKRGNPSIGGPTDVAQAYVTREYQICLKCHSNYAFNTPPMLGSSGGGTPSGTNGMTQYTNQAMEVQAPLAHKGLTGSPGDSGAFAGTPPSQAYTVDFQTNNRRGGHPIMDSTGRSPVRVFEGNDINAGTTASAFRAPWNAAVGTQTMYCSDCHGSATATGTAEPSGGENGNPWGPHGSNNDFLLKGNWNRLTGTNQQDDICFKCHDYNAYAATGVSGRTKTYMSGFSGQGTYNKMYNLHLEHGQRLGKMRCSWCHVAVPHGWKNKAMLVNLNDVGPEASCTQDDIDDGVSCTLGQPHAPGTQVRLGGTPSPGGSFDPYYWNKAYHSGYNNPPYYLNAANKIINFKDSGDWTANDCGSVGAPGTGQVGMCAGSQWAVQSEGCNLLP